MVCHVEWTSVVKPRRERRELGGLSKYRSLRRHSTDAVVTGCGTMEA